MDCFVNRAQAATAQNPHYLVFPDYLPGLKRHRLMILPALFPGLGWLLSAALPAYTRMYISKPS